MKKTFTCPKCQHRKLWMIDRVGVIQVKLEQVEFDGQMHTGVSTHEVGGFEALVCEACGYTECYATTFEHIAKVGKLVEAGVGVYR